MGVGVEVSVEVGVVSSVGVGVGAMIEMVAISLDQEADDLAEV